MSQTVGRALSILELFADGPRTLGEIAAHLGVHKSTALRLVQSLESAGFARQIANTYTFGFRMVSLAQISLEQLDLRRVAHPYLVHLAEQMGHTIHLAQLVGDEIVYIDKVEGHGQIQMRSQVGHAVQLHTAGVAKAILAHVTPALRGRLMARVAYTGFTERTLTTPDELEADLLRTRERGWAEDDGELEDYLNCVALPVRDATGAVIAGLSVTSLRALAPLPQLRENLDTFRETADAVSAQMGWSKGQAVEFEDRGASRPTTSAATPEERD